MGVNNFEEFCNLDISTSTSQLITHNLNSDDKGMPGFILVSCCQLLPILLVVVRSYISRKDPFSSIIHSPFWVKPEIQSSGHFVYAIQILVISNNIELI